MSLAAAAFAPNMHRDQESTVNRRKELLVTVAEFESVLRQSAGLGHEGRKEMIALRRSLGTLIQRLASLGEEAFSNAEDRHVYRNELSRMRSAMALHHASWPIVSIDSCDQDYVASLRSTRDANRTFIEWVKRALR